MGDKDAVYHTYTIDGDYKVIRGSVFSDDFEIVCNQQNYNYDVSGHKDNSEYMNPVGTES